jgi:hypothetical protein
MLNLIVIHFQILAAPCDQGLLFLKILGLSICTATIGAVLGGHDTYKRSFHGSKLESKMVDGLMLCSRERRIVLH